MAMAESRMPPADPSPPEMHRSTDDTRAGSTEHVVRYVLAISLVLAILAMIILFLWGSFGQ